MLINNQENNPNKNKVFIYTDKCKLCGSASEEFKDILSEIKRVNKIPVIKQVSLWQGWKQEATKIGLEMPFVWAFDSRRGMTVDDFRSSSIEELLTPENV